MIEIKTTSLAKAYQVLEQIPEFVALQPIAKFAQRLEGKTALILVAYDRDLAVGVKMGYALSDSVFYTWMGGVIPAYRGQGIAQQLADVQVAWVCDQGFETIQLKTRNRFKGMLHFALSDGFDLIGVSKEKADSIADYRILLEKKLS
ncbi:GNAT family N-acetyltransferase [Penaeicola halotolerans]|uniref:GNAT family N-acetyltransferase n=1 Tax=Penaeicola halotolerans TaxID=2793196 RepID=UPI001CF8F023|nr:GNAT family N-acetyltransferase [Penaeicola halotolerans]